MAAEARIPRREEASEGLLRVALGIGLLAALMVSPTRGADARSAGEPALTRAAGEASSTALDQAVEGRPVILVTGSTSGLGREVALRLASTGAHLIIHGRDRERGQEVVAEIEEQGRGSARFYRADFASLAEVRSFAEIILTDYPRLDLLINNAGIWRQEREVSADGHELHFAVNYLSGYLLTRLLLPRLVESAPSRIVNVASGAQVPIDFADPMLESGYSDFRAYAQSKLAQVLFTVDLAEELAAEGVLAVALHPASLMDTPMVLSRGLAARTSVDEGADAVVYLATAPGVESGRYYDGRSPARPHAQALDAEARALLRELSDRLTGGGRRAGGSLPP